MTSRATLEQLQAAAYPAGTGGLIEQAAALGVCLEARPGGRLWADRRDLLPAALRNSLAAHRPAVVQVLIEQTHRPPPRTPAPTLPQLLTEGLNAASERRARAANTLPGVPPDWCRGVVLLATRPPPHTIHPQRWAILAATSARLLGDHGAELHRAGWGALGLFGLDPTAPATNPPGWGLAWLLGEHGDVLDVSPGVVGMRRDWDGARLAFRRRPTSGGSVLAWLLV